MCKRAINKCSPDFRRNDDLTVQLQKMSLSNKIRGIREIWFFDNHWYLALTRFLFPDENVNIYRYKGLEVLIDHAAGDANGAREVLTSEMYRQFLPQMDLSGEINVFDLGANNGGFPLLLKTEGLKIKKSVSVELNPNTFSRLRFNLERNLQDRAVALNNAVCGARQTFSVRLGTGGASDSIYQNTIGDNAQSFAIEGKTFDEIYLENFGDETIDVCKMDIEGAEFEIFAAGTCEKMRDCRYFIIEIHHEKDRRRERILEKLGELGFVELNAEGKSGDDYYVHFFVNQKFSKTI